MSTEAPRESRRRPRLLSPYEQYQLYQRSEPVALGETRQTANDIIAAAEKVGALIDEKGFPKDVQSGAGLCHQYLPLFVQAGMLRKQSATNAAMLFLSRQVMYQARHGFHLEDRKLLVGLMAEASFARAFFHSRHETDIRLHRTTAQDDMVEKTDFLVEWTPRKDVTCLGRVDVKAKQGKRSVVARENQHGVLEVHVPLYFYSSIQPEDGTPLFSFPPDQITVDIQDKVGRYLSAIGDSSRFRDIPLEW